MYQWKHWQRYRNRALSHYSVTGYVAFAAVVLNAVSGVILAAQAVFGTRISYVWDDVHIVTTVAVVAFVVPHVVLLFLRSAKATFAGADLVLAAERRWVAGTLGLTAVGFSALLAFAWMYTPVEWVDRFPEDYVIEEGRTPFSPSLAMTETGGAFDERTLSGSEGCGSSGCHEQIYEEWSISAHRWSSMDPAFQVIQELLATQNGPESTRYCGGCHDSISLFAGTKNIFNEELSSLRGYNEGVSCLVCHSVRETDLQGNAAYTVAKPDRYMFELAEDGAAKFVSDFLIRAYPRHHVAELSKSLYKTPEYCAACHKQFIDAEINNVGWVQLQNQYDNWKQSRWHKPDDVEGSITCRECHMRLVDSSDPAAGDTVDYNRSADDGKHRSHRFIGANQYLPTLLELPGAEEQVRLIEEWLRGDTAIPEIADKWTDGAAIPLQILAPVQAVAGQEIRFQVVVLNNKAGHDFPTGPLDIIQAWIEVEVTDAAGNVIFVSGNPDDKGFLPSGTTVFKAEAVDQFGNLIDKHNLWEMVGARFKRTLFPGYSDVATYAFFCPDQSNVSRQGEQATGESDGTSGVEPQSIELIAPEGAGELIIRARLRYRKVDQYLVDFLFPDQGLTAHITDMSEAVARVPIIEAK